MSILTKVINLLILRLNWYSFKLVHSLIYRRAIILLNSWGEGFHLCVFLLMWSWSCIAVRINSRRSTRRPSWGGIRRVLHYSHLWIMSFRLDMLCVKCQVNVPLSFFLLWLKLHLLYFQKVSLGATPTHLRYLQVEHLNLQLYYSCSQLIYFFLRISQICLIWEYLTHLELSFLNLLDWRYLIVSYCL